MSRLVLDPRPRPQFSVFSSQSHGPGSSSEYSVSDHADQHFLNRPESGSRHKLRSLPPTASNQGPGSRAERERETGSGTGREREAGTGSGTERSTEREAGSGSGRDTGRASKTGLNIDTDSRMKGESSSTPRGHLESESFDGSKNDLMQWKGTVEPVKLGVWNGVNKVPSQGQGEAPSWARNREGDRNRAEDEDEDEEDRTCLSGRTADQPKAVTAVVGKKVVPQRAHLSDAQKDSIIRQIRAASAGRVRRPVLQDPLSTEDEYDDEGREGDTGRNTTVTEHTVEDRSVVRSQVQQGVSSRGQEQQQKMDSGMHDTSRDPRDADTDMISSLQQQQRKNNIDISHVPSSLSSYSHTSSDGTYPREGAPEDGGVVALQKYSSNVKTDAIPESGSRVHKNNEVIKNNITEGIQEEKEQDRGTSRESKKKGSFIECGGLIEEDEVKRLAKFEKMKEKKIAEAHARLLVRYSIFRK